MKRYCLYPLLFLILLAYYAPIPSLAQAKGDTLSLQAYVRQVLEHHPAARSASLLEEQGRLEVLSARGAFDPVLRADVDEKQFQDKTYYRIFNTEVKATTRLGIGLKAGYDYAQGDYLNPEWRVPSGGLWYAGLSVPLLQGMIFDEGRSLLRQARVRQERYQWEQRQLRANLLYEATIAYWQWAGQQQQVNTLMNAVDAAQQRFRIVKSGYTAGELPAIDTLEAFLQLQSLQSSLLEQTQELVKARQTAIAFYWNESGDAYWSDSWQPSPLPATSLADSLMADAPLANWAAESPVIRQYALKISELETERRWKSEKLKPMLNANYNVISADNPAENPASYSINNYKFGVSFKMPLLLRNERGALALTRLKIQTANLEQRQKQQEVNIKLAALLASLQLLHQQNLQNQQLVEGYRMLWLGEQQKFEYGESTLFYVNTREIKYLESRLKLLSLQVKFKEQEAELRRLLGITAL